MWDKQLKSEISDYSKVAMDFLNKVTNNETWIDIKYDIRLKMTLNICSSDRRCTM